MPGEWLHWSGDSSRLHWSLGSQLFQRDLNQTFAFVDGAPEELPKPAETGIEIGFSQAYRRAGRHAGPDRRAVDHHERAMRSSRTAWSWSRATASPPSGRVPRSTVPAGATVIDMTGKTIMPGLIDAHWHGSMGSDEIIPQQSWINYGSWPSA